MMDLRLISINVNSIINTNRRLLLQKLIGENEADIYLLQETKIGNGLSFQQNGYNFFHQDRKMGAGGTAILINNKFRVRNLSTCNDGIEYTSVEIKINELWVRIVSVYISPSGVSYNNFIRLFKKNIPTIYAGDFNARHISFGDFSDNVNGITLSKIASQTGIKIISSKYPTCFRSEMGSFIDKFIFNMDFPYSFTGIKNIASFSDHNAISISVHCNINRNTEDGGFYIRKFNYTNTNKLNKHILSKFSQMNLITNGNINNVDLESIAEHIHGCLLESIEKFVPVEEIKTNRIILSTATIKLQKHQHTLLRKLHRNLRLGTNSYNINAIKKEIKLSKNMLLNAVSYDVNNFYRNMLANTNTMGKAYTTIKCSSSYKRRKKCPNILYKNETKDIHFTGNEEIVEAFAEQFSVNHELSINLSSPQ